MTTTERSFARRIDLTSLQLFVAVCELGSIGRAAEREFIAASAISKRLSDLEATLGTPLLYRHTRGVDLTPAGESLLHHARSVLYSLEKMQGELSEYADGVRGHVRVHANISAIVQFLPEDLGVFRRAHEEIKIDLEEHLSTEVLRAVQEGAADLGICHLAEGASELQSLVYRHDRLVLIVPTGHALADQGPLDFMASLDHDHVGLHTNSSIYVATRQAAMAAGRSIKLRIHVTGLDAMCRMIENGLGIGVMPGGAFELMRGGVGRRLTSVALTNDWAQREIRLVARDFSTLPVAARTLVAHLQASGEAVRTRAEPRAIATSLA
ncbi:LysR substrate-binding domain-containing protein [Variovorax ginsengisoli]|uniref:LysR substrate-binding domain-containing protein n=1 Tax=Variovorax ginsengisoli TaxID=363844 RepID=UPI0027D8285A|nr:LysR substrate-binding domain-containing protein [Variovorax ginsengisoli]